MTDDATRPLTAPIAPINWHLLDHLIIKFTLTSSKESCTRPQRQDRQDFLVVVCTTSSQQSPLIGIPNTTPCCIISQTNGTTTDRTAVSSDADGRNCSPGLHFTCGMPLICGCDSKANHSSHGTDNIITDEEFAYCIQQDSLGNGQERNHIG